MPNTQTTTPTATPGNEDGMDIPAVLRRTPKAANPNPEAKSPAAQIAAKHNATATPKAAKPAKVAKPKTEKKTKAAHQPSTIARTEDNPIRSIVPAKFKAAYSEHQGTCGDKMGLALKAATTHKNSEGRDALDLPALKAIAKLNAVDVSRYEGLNPGQWRMNVGNKLRGLLKAGKKVMIGKQVFADAEKALAKQQVAA